MYICYLKVPISAQSYYLETGTVQGKLEWFLHKDDTQIWKKAPVFVKYISQKN